MAYTKAYIRPIIDKEYPTSLADSVHFALGVDLNRMEPINQN